MSEKMMYLFSKEEIARVKDTVRMNGKHLVTVDMHGLRAKEAKRFLKNLIAVNKDGCEMCVIHGYKHGTAIRDIVNHDNFGKRVVGRFPVKNNPGRTRLMLCAA